MKHIPRAAAVAAVLALATGLVTACNANDKSTPGGGSSSAAAEPGGTFHILTTSKEISLDPAKSQNLGVSTIHLVLRGLTSWKTTPGKGARTGPGPAPPHPRGDGGWQER